LLRLNSSEPKQGQRHKKPSDTGDRPPWQAFPSILLQHVFPVLNLVADAMIEVIRLNANSAIIRTNNQSSNGKVMLRRFLLSFSSPSVE